MSRRPDTFGSPFRRELHALKPHLFVMAEIVNTLDPKQKVIFTVAEPSDQGRYETELTADISPTGLWEEDFPLVHFCAQGRLSLRTLDPRDLLRKIEHWCHLADVEQPF